MFWEAGRMEYVKHVFKEAFGHWLIRVDYE